MCPNMPCGHCADLLLPWNHEGPPAQLLLVHGSLDLCKNRVVPCCHLGIVTLLAVCALTKWSGHPPPPILTRE